MDRKLASIQIIKDIQPIIGADAIMLATVLGWNCVVKKTEFKVGDKCVYFEIDSILPVEPWNAHLRKGSDALKPLRVKTIRLRGQLSQGLALPMSLLTEPEGNYEVGQDVTELAGVKKWEAYIPAELHGKVKGNRPPWIPKTDEPRFQSYPDALDELLSWKVPVVGTVKKDGSSISAYIRDGVFGVTSRQMELIETPDNAYWKAVRMENVEEKMRKFFPCGTGDGNYAIQGELCGPGIQGNKMGLDKLTIFWYNAYSIDGALYLGDKILTDFTLSSNLNKVETFYYGYLPVDATVKSLLEMANNLNYTNNTPAEGIVWRTVEERYSCILKGRMSVKTISNRFLETYKE